MPLFNKWCWETGYPQAKVRSYLTPTYKSELKINQTGKHKSWSYRTHRRKFRGKLLTLISWRLGAPLAAQMVKNLPTMRETWVHSLGREDPLEKRMAIHSSILAWEISWTEEPGGLQSKGSQRVRYNWAAFSLYSIKDLYPGYIKKKKKLIQLNNYSKFLNEQRTWTDISPKKMHYTNGQ